MEAKEEEWIQKGQVVKSPPREPEMTPQNPGRARQRTEYTEGDYGRCDQLERVIEVNESCMTNSKWHEDLQVWSIQD